MTTRPTATTNPSTQQRRLHRVTADVEPRRFRRMLRAAGRPSPSSVLIGLLTTIFMVLRTLWPNRVGSADSVDGIRYICQVGLVKDAPGPQYWYYAIMNYKPGPAPWDCPAYPSSFVWVLRATQWITGVFGGTPGHMNLAWLIVFNCILVGILVGLIAFAVRRNIWLRVFVALAAVFILADGAFVGYAGSIYAEWVGIAGVGIAAVGSIYVATHGGKQWLGLILVTVGAFAAITSKTQGVTLLLPVAVLLVCSTMRRRPGRVSEPWWNIDRLALTVFGKSIPILLALALVVPAVMMERNNPTDFKAINPWETISVGILGHVDHPDQTLEEMGLPVSLAKYAGRSVGDDNLKIMQDADWIGATDRMTYGTIAKYLAAHPLVALDMANRNGTDYFEIRPGYLGSYTIDAGKPKGALDTSNLAQLGHTLRGLGITPLLAIWGLVTWGGVVLLRNSEVGGFRRGFATATLFLVACSVVQYGTATYGEAIENTKHMVYGILAGSLAIVALIAGSMMVRDVEDR